MEVPGRCEGCRQERLVFDAIFGVVACDACGRMGNQTETELSSEWQTGHVIERGGTYVGESDTGVAAARKLMRGQRVHRFQSDGPQCRDRYRLETMKKVDAVAAILRVPKDKVAEAKQLLQSLLNGEWGTGRWVEIAVAACLYVVIRQSQLPLTVPEVADSVNCDVFELGRMYNRVLQQLDITLPIVDGTVFLERAASTLPALKKSSKDDVRKITKEGSLLLNYSQESFISTGRRPLPVVAAVLFLVLEANKVVVEIAEVAREVHAGLWTTKRRYKEWQLTLVGIGQSLPWGKDITLKSVPRHLPFILQFIELKAKLEKKKKGLLETSESVASPGLEIVSSLKKSPHQQQLISSVTTVAANCMDIAKTMQNGPQRVSAEELPFPCQHSPESYVSGQAGRKTPNCGETGVARSLVNSSEDHNLAVRDMSEAVVQERPTKLQKVLHNTPEHENRRAKAATADGLRFAESDDHWHLLSLSRIAESNSVGPDKAATSFRIPVHKETLKPVKWTGLPVAFCASLEARARRRLKIDRAKKRISEAKQALTNRFVKPHCVLEPSVSARGGRKPPNSTSAFRELDSADLDSEDLVIEHLVLSGANEAELENGYYDTLLALYPEHSETELINDGPESYIRSSAEVKQILDLTGCQDGDNAA